MRCTKARRGHSILHTERSGTSSGNFSVTRGPDLFIYLSKERNTDNAESGHVRLLENYKSEW